MMFINLAGIYIVITLSFPSTMTLGEKFLTPETGKTSTAMKVPDKRSNNFRVPMEMPYDPNFWPARGRRSRRYPEKAIESDNCATDGNYPDETTKLRCQMQKIREEEKPSFQDFDSNLNFDEDLSNDFDSKCFGKLLRAAQRPKNSFEEKMANFLEKNPILSPRRLGELRYKKQRHPNLPELFLYGNGVYWEPENSYGEKKKKEDVFWVARGKKDYFALN